MGPKRPGLAVLPLSFEWNDHPARLSVAYDQHVESHSHVTFFYHNHRYKSVATQIPHDVGLQGPQ